MAQAETAEKPQLYRAHVLFTAGDDLETTRLVSHRDGAVVVRSGRVLATGDFSRVSSDWPEADVIDQRGSYLLPGFVDTHVHLPQLAVIGSMGLTLLDWLEQRTFPEELRFADEDYAREKSEQFLQRLLHSGTTSALVFGAHQKIAMDEFFRAAHDSGLRIAAGLVLGDENLPEGLTTTPERAVTESLELISNWHGRGRLRYAVTPRFSVSASDALLAACGKVLSSAENLLFTTHLNEMPGEIELVAERFPDAVDYLDTYERHGLVTERSLFAHNVHPTAAELVRLARAGSAVCHCPTSNLFLGSGLFPLAAHVNAGVRVGLGTDVGGGTGYSVPDEALHAYLHQMNRPDGWLLAPEQLLHLATRAGALALGLGDSGNFETGNFFDAVFLQARPGSTLEARLDAARDADDVLAGLITLAREDAVRHVLVAGERLLWDREPCPGPVAADSRL